MSGTKLITAAVLLLLSWNTHQASAQVAVSIDVDYTRPPGFTLGPDEYRAASGPVVVTCTASRAGGTNPDNDYTYQWSSDCKNCPFQLTNAMSTRREISRETVSSNEGGTHTCKAIRVGQSANGSASIVFNIVGAGIHFATGSPPTGSQPNNGLARSRDVGGGRRLRFFCRSDSTMNGVGQLIGLDGTAITNSSFFDINNSNRGEVNVESVVGTQDVLTASGQGVYTCRIPLQSGEMREINIGIYPNTFNSGPTITNPLVFAPGSSSSTLTCTSTASVATNVTFMRDNITAGVVRDGDSMTVIGVTYQLAQTLTNRGESTYENVLTITGERFNLTGSSFTCQVENVLGSATSQSFIIPAALTVNISVSYTPPPGFIPGDSTEYKAASGPVIVTCTASEGAGSGDYVYVWTSTCSSGCDFQRTSTGRTSVINRQAVHSGDTGTHTCTATRGGESASASIMFNVVGDGGSSNGGAIAGGIIGAIIAVVLIVLIIILAVWLWRRRDGIGKPYALAPSVRENTTGQESIRYTRTTDEVTAKKSTNVSPIIQEFPENDVTFLEGEGLSFAIRITGFPTPSTVWYQDGKELVSDYSLEMVGDGSLTILSVEPRHSGTYKLVVTNQAGSMDKTVKVSVLLEAEATPTAPRQQQLDITAIPVAEFGKYVATNHSNNNRGFQDLYGALYSSDEHPVALAKSAKNRPLNRFANITVYDDHRILLQPLPGHSDCQRDYVNASYIDGYSIPKKFIATQGPLPKTNVDFWRLVWQERPPSIVMVTNLQEGNKIKCQQYWPESGNKTFGPFQITVTDQQTFADYVIRTFSVSLSGSSERPLKVTQFHFTAWPDHGVPEYATPILTFHRRVTSQHIPSRGPLLVHCSAGIGRTGTFITVDCVLEQLQREHVIDIFSTINRIRQQRMKLVQTAEQFSFVHDAVLESVTCGDTQIAANNFRSAIRNLGGRNPQTRQSGFESQFQVLHQVSPKPDEVRREAAIHHCDMNRSMDYLPPDQYRVVLKGEVPDYIHAISANGYKQQKAFIIAENPLESSCRNFWKMLYSRKCAAIVMLSRLVENGQEVCYQYWPTSGVKQFGEFTVDLLGEEKLEGFVLRTLSILDTKSGKAHQITQFHIVNWTPDGHCSNLKTVTEIIEEVGKVQRKTGNHPVAIHCSDTVCRSGMFCSIATTIERCKTEGVVDVFQVVKALRVQKPGAVLTVAQYQQVFEAVLVYLESFDTYANFQNI